MSSSKHLGLFLSPNDTDFESIMPLRANLKLLHTRIWILDYLKVSTCRRNDPHYIFFYTSHFKLHRTENAHKYFQ